MLGVTFTLPEPGHVTVPTPLLMLQDTKAALPCVALYESPELTPLGTVVGDAEREHEGGEYASALRGITKNAQPRMIAASSNEVRSRPDGTIRRLNPS